MNKKIPSIKVVSTLEREPMKYAYITSFPFTFLFFSWLLLDKCSPGSAIAPTLFIVAFFNLFPAIILEEIIKKVFIKEQGFEEVTGTKLSKTNKRLALERQAKNNRELFKIALAGVIKSLNEIQDNIYFVLKELPNVELPEDLLKQVKSVLKNFSTSMFWDIKKEVSDGQKALSSASDDEVLDSDWQEREIFASISLTNSYMQDDFSRLDKIIQKLQEPEFKEFGSARILIMESVVNMLNANKKNSERYKNLQKELLSEK